MQIDTLIAALEQLKAAAKGSPSRTGGFTGQKGLFDKAIRALEPYASRSLAEALAELNEAAKPKKPARKPKAKAAPKTKIDTLLVQRYQEALEFAVAQGYEQARAVQDRLKADKVAKLPELRALCEAFVGSSAGIKSKAAALGRIDKAIRSRIFNR
jgi:hypothetical protein